MARATLTVMNVRGDVEATPFRAFATFNSCIRAPFVDGPLVILSRANFATFRVQTRASSEIRPA